MALDTDNYIDPGTGQRDPACLRLVDFRLDQSNVLHMVVYFRSWDLWGGFPANLAGLQLVKEYVCQAIGATDGKIIASSKGLHLYDHAIQVAAERLGMAEVGTMDDFLKHCASIKTQ
jgi:thymidylate synthase